MSAVSLTMMEQKSVNFDRLLLACVVALLCVGFIAMSSASMEYAAVKYNNPFFHIQRYGIHLLLGCLAALMAYRIPMSFWQQTGWLWLLFAFALLALVLIPGIGREVNGSRRWVALGPLTLQCSEIAKACVILYLAGYLVRRQQEVRERFSGFIKPMALLFFVTLLLLLEPDFGATVVTVATAFGMLFLAGARLGQFILVILSAVMALVVMIWTSPYRMQRLTAFTDPWADQFNSGYQLTQALIAFGRGEWFGVGLGNSVQKLFYLPEAHTDFVFAILAEEFGLLGSLLVIALFVLLIVRILQLGLNAERYGKVFGAYVCYGVAFMISGQVFINIGVNTGLLPTKGLTLPFLSYGGSSLIVCCGLLGVVMRVHAELYQKRGANDGDS